MSSKLSLSPILVFWFLVIFAPWYFWGSIVENPPHKDTLTVDDRGRLIHEVDKVSILISTGVSLLMFVGGAVGVYRKSRKEGVVAPLKITLAAIFSSCALFGSRRLEDLASDSFLARFYERQSFRYGAIVFLFAVATIVLLGVAIREQRGVKATSAGE